MEFLTELWLPIVLSAVFVFIASSVIHMALPIHKGDKQKLPGEEAITDAMRSQGLQPGDYMFPCPSSMKDMGSPEMVEKFKRGPVGYLTVVPSGPPAMGKSLVQWFVYSLVVGFFVAYVAWHSLAPGADYLGVFRLTGTIAFLTYGLSSIPGSIWWGCRWSTTFKFVFDGLIYGLVTAGAFGWLWPAAAA